MKTERNSVTSIEWNWDKFDIVPEYYDRILAAHQPLAAKGGNILEIGVGCGYVLSHLRQERRVLECVGIDSDPDALVRSRRVAEETGVRLALVRADGKSLPFPTASFDMVFSVGVIEHFDIPTAAALLQEHVRVARPGGIVAVSVPNRWNIFHTFLKWRLGVRYPYYPERSYAPSELSRELRSHGLEIQGEEGWGLFWSLWHMPWKWSYYLSAIGIRMGFNNDYERRLSPKWRSRLGMSTMVWGRRPTSKEAEK